MGLDDFELTDESACPNCGHETDGEAFCPHCGAAIDVSDDEEGGYSEDGDFDDYI